MTNPPKSKKMKIKIAMTTVLLLCISYSSIGQSNTTDFKSITITNNTLQKHNLSYTANSVEANKNVAEQSKNTTIYSEKKWKKIRKQIEKNKKRASKYKSSVYASKKIDTIYLDIPNNSGKSRLSGW
ncbi:hypothetical protein ATO12_12190 [Aquimarina atlantica]|uniref:Uncharacterized protein n=2 Tax=Aquimarina atlantica TaxID=1317122 RepID=A0A023BY28_9FLAO|nr:hypothetical protein ATO12_12190 [Aquimarina atlantica]